MRLLVRTWMLLAIVLVSARTASSQDFRLPDGRGKDLVERHCMRCHDAEKLAGPDGGHWPAFGPGKSPEEWQRVMTFMGTYGLTLTKEEVPIVTAYLTKALAGPARPTGVRMAGPIEATIREWKVTPGTRPHDPTVAPGGAVWYTGQASSRLGRLDPSTGEVRNYPLRPDNTKLPYGVGPHGLVADKDGYIWYTGQQDGHLGKLDPKSGVVTKYKIPNPSAGGPHTPIFDQKGTLWFTMQQGNMVGRLTPATGEIKLVMMPTANSEPYGLVINSKGVPFFTQWMGHRSAAARGDARRHHLLHGLRPGNTRPPRSRDRADEGVDVAERRALAALCHHGFRQDRLVRGRQRQPQHARAIRSGDGQIPDVADSSVGRRRCPPHGGWA